jgi:serine/threonine protein kinase
LSTPRIERYEIQREIGRGGMAIVYLARDPERARAVAIKVLPREFMFSPKFRARFEREAKVMTSLQIPGIVPVYDFGEYEGQSYLVMQYMVGGGLNERLLGGPLSLAESSDILNYISPALDEAHRRKMIHRDLKPGNILFDEANRAYLADFGVVKLTEGQSITITTQGGIVGTPAYMSPEQVMGKDELDGRSDVYALGVILYQMLSGHVPYKSDTPMGQAMMHIVEPLPELRTIRPDLPEETQTIVATAMAKNKEDRYPTAQALAAAVGSLAARSGAAAAVPVPKSKNKFPIALLLVGLLVVLCFISVGAGAAYIISNGGDQDATSTATLETLTDTPDTETKMVVTMEAPSTAAIILPGGLTRTRSSDLDAQGASGILPTLRATSGGVGADANGTQESAPTQMATNTRPQDAPSGPTLTSQPATSTPELPPLATNTPEPPPPATNTPEPATNTPEPPTNTPEPPTDTPEPPTAEPPTNTPLPAPTATPFPTIPPTPSQFPTLPPPPPTPTPSP